MNEQLSRGYARAGSNMGQHYDGASQCQMHGARALGPDVDVLEQKRRAHETYIATGAAKTLGATLGGLIDRDRSPIDQALARVDSGLNALHDTIERLEGRLFPVLQPDTLGNAAHGGLNETKPMSGPTVMALEAYSDRLASAMTRLEAVIRRLEC